MKNLHTHFEVMIQKHETTDSYKSAQSPFYATRTLFRNYLNYTKPLTYLEWLSTPDDDKAAVLYVQFFEQITLAWYKVKSFYTNEEDGVETILQYLIKNVPVIVDDPKRFKPNYIYRVAFNCLYCICHDIQRDKDRFEMECSNMQGSGEEEFDLFDQVIDSETISDICTRESFWEVINSLGLDDELLEFVYSLADVNPPKRLNDQKRAVIEQLRIVLAPYKDMYGE